MSNTNKINMSRPSTENTQPFSLIEPIDIVSTLSQPMLGILVFAIGIYFHCRIINISRKEKEITSNLDITNSCILICHFFYSLFMHIITLIVQDLHIYTGDWYCYLSKVIIYYGNRYMQGHTLVICIMKYILVVHWDTARALGHDQIANIFFWINIVHPLIDIGAHLFVTPNFFWAYDGYRQIDRCLGDPKHFFNSKFNTTRITLGDLCHDLSPFSDNYLDYVLYKSRQGVCWTQIVVFYSVLGNFLEILIYIRLFWFVYR